jgi:DNA-binding NarL/FixJ family response regulator
MRQNKATSDVPVVIYSTSISRKDIEDTSIFNVKSYLQKPEDFQSLCQKLEEVVLTGA